MKVVISPAKSLNYSSQLPTQEFTEAEFLNQSNKIQTVTKKLKPKDLMKLMSISEKLAELNWQRNQDWNLPITTEKGRPAIFAFDGDVYTGFDAYSLPLNKIDDMQSKVRILSGLYGLLKPMDLILPYRLEMGTSIAIGTKKNLYDFWKKTITDKLNSELSENELLVNLASNEYSSAIDFKNIKATVITPEFKDYKDGKLKMISFFAKKARGLMARFIVENNVETIEDLMKFNLDGYAYDASLSSKNKLVFTR